VNQLKLSDAKFFKAIYLENVPASTDGKAI
jgi:hypothetical protein